MEIESSTKYCRVKGEPSEEDRLSGLPDDNLHSIVGRVPLKQAVRTSALSTIPGHPSSSAGGMTTPTALRVGAEGVLGQVVPAPSTPGPLTAGGGSRPALPLATGASREEVVAFGGIPDPVSEGRRMSSRLLDHPEVDDMQQRCATRAAKLRGIEATSETGESLFSKKKTDDAVRDVVYGCRLLEFLSLESCHLLVSMRVTGERLLGLEIVRCLAMRHLQVAAPVLESVVYHGNILLIWREDEPSGVEFVGPSGRIDARPELKDAYVTHIGYGEYDEVIHEFAYSGFLDQVAHANLLTLCSVGMLGINGSFYTIHLEEERLFTEGDMDAPNLEELQLLMDSISMGDDDVTRFSRFLELVMAPLLERLLIRFPDACGGTAVTGEGADIILECEIALDHLTFLKARNFRGTMRELRLLRFVMHRAPVLEQLVLVSPEDMGTPGDHDQQESVWPLLKVVQEHVSEISKAWLWQEPHVTVCQPREDDSRALHTPSTTTMIKHSSTRAIFFARN
ncbi:hypothetical protein VPH35_110369 [Triticum aestivum]